jgi:hypothetical protein
MATDRRLAIEYRALARLIPGAENAGTRDDVHVPQIPIRGIG